MFLFPFRQIYWCLCLIDTGHKYINDTHGCRWIQGQTKDCVCNASSKMVRCAYTAQRRAVCNGPNKGLIGGTRSLCVLWRLRISLQKDDRRLPRLCLGALPTCLTLYKNLPGFCELRSCCTGPSFDLLNLIFFYDLITSKEQSPSWEAPRLLWNQTFHWHVHLSWAWWILYSPR